MDVSSLLNSNSVAAGQQEQKEISDATVKNRTPWDADGYSLPITNVGETNSTDERNTTISTDDGSQKEHSLSPEQGAFNPQNSLPSLKQHLYSPSQESQSLSKVALTNSAELDSGIHTVQDDNSHQEQPTMLQHKFSDSRSSLSSFTSSLHSASHSRISSTSTIWSSQVDTAFDNQPRSVRSRSLEDATALVGEKGWFIRQANQPVELQERPASPSDAMLIKRTNLPPLKVDTGEDTLKVFDRTQLGNPLHSTLLHKQDLELGTIQLRGHKRALSAPDPSFVMADFTRHSVLQQPGAELTPPSSHHPDQCSPAATLIHVAPATPPASAGQVEDQSITCMYIANCDTGSQPRKAISHIFGRNKMCTRKIPQNVWVHYCRKHYQRSRYRNPKEYAKLQCDLVQQQIRRVHDWSENNLQTAQPGVVQDWGLAIRKREQKRLDDMGSSSRKRSAATFDQNDSEDGDNGDDIGDRRNSVPLTAVPDWLLALCGKGYSTTEILEIFSRLHSEILEDRMPCFPDIEILPNIIMDDEDPDSPQRFTKRKPTASVHRRSQSLSVTTISGATQSDQSVEQAVSWVVDERSSYQKRRRPNEGVLDSPALVNDARMLDMPTESSRRLQKLVHRPIFANIDENHAEDGYRASTADQSYSVPSHSSSPPLFSHETQRRSGPLIPLAIESGPYKRQRAVRRSTHQRSQSDMGSFYSSAVSYPNTSTPNSSLVNAYEQTRPTTSHSYGQSESYTHQGYRARDTYRHESSESQRVIQGPVMEQFGHQKAPALQPFYLPSSLSSYGREPQPHYKFHSYLEGARTFLPPEVQEPRAYSVRC
ncbi:hypothetical protein B7463_g5388, partial [Scytalidium lignicola]